eukprot:XP_022272218.1 zinc finger MIZ domain-containing protein 2 [Canis lupus familiaris]
MNPMHPVKPALPPTPHGDGPFAYEAVPWQQSATQPAGSLSVVTTVWGVGNAAQSQVLGNPMGPAGSPPGGSVMPGMAGSGSALNSPQCLGQQAFGEGAANKGFVQQGVYGRGGYPGGPGFTPGYAGGPGGLGLPSHATRPSTDFTQAAAAAAVAAAAPTATATATATVAALQEKQSQELSQYGAVRPGRSSHGTHVYPGQQYLPGGQYGPSATQYTPGAGQSSAPSSYAGHRLPLQQGLAQSLPAPGPAGLHYKPTEQFNGQGTSFNGGSVGYSQHGLSGPTRSIPGYPSSPLPGSPTPPMTPGSSVPYMSTSQEVKSPFLSDLKPSVSSLHPSPPGECHLLSGPQWPAGNVGDGGPCFDLESYLQLNCERGTWRCPVCNKTALLEGLEVDQYMLGILIYIQNSDYEEITIDPTCSWKPVPVKPDVHVKEEPDGPVLKRCRTVSPAHVLMPSVMEMIAALGPGAAPFAPLQPPSAPAPGDYPSQASSFLGPGTFPDSFPPATPSTPALPEFTAGPPPSSYQSDLPSSLLTPEKSTPCLPGQMAPAGHLDPAHNPGAQGLHAPSLGGPPGAQLHHANPPPASRQPLGPVSSGPLGELGFSAAAGVMGPPMSGAGEAPEPALDLLPELTNPEELLSYLGPPDLPTNNNDDLLSLFENN